MPIFGRRRFVVPTFVLLVMFWGSISSAAVGDLAIRFLLRFLANHTLRIFAYYRFALAAVVAVVLLTSDSYPPPLSRRMICR